MTSLLLLLLLLLFPFVDNNKDICYLYLTMCHSVCCLNVHIKLFALFSGRSLQYLQLFKIRMYR